VRTGQRMTNLHRHWTTLALCLALQSLQTAVLNPETYNTIFSTRHLLGLGLSHTTPRPMSNCSYIRTRFL